METNENTINKQGNLLKNEHPNKSAKNKMIHISKLIFVFIIMFFILSYMQNPDIYGDLNIFSH